MSFPLCKVTNRSVICAVRVKEVLVVDETILRNDECTCTTDETIAALVTLVAQKDHTAEGHSARVSEYAMAIGRRLGLSAGALRTLRHAAALHDIGKVAVSRQILVKMGKLTDEEFEVMKIHSTVAMHVLDRVDALRDAVPLVKHHHERWDGKGYPDGLNGDDIPIGSRIISVAEAYDILTSDVPWRDAVDGPSAMSELKSCAGTQFDPVVVHTWQAIMECNSD
jgi:HD-GYP domain-containing protein (c-di-GMP phosphodiesterase class II)